MQTPEAIEGVLEVADAHAGGTGGWLVAHGAAQAELDRWDERLLDGRV
jgi:protein-tyrosine phosphatase